ncbi:hypothetical protein, partial [Ferruginibacter sp.]
VKLNKYISFFAGPSFSVFVSNQHTAIANYRYPVPPTGYKPINFGTNVNGWFGWNAGINFF